MEPFKEPFIKGAQNPILIMKTPVFRHFWFQVPEPESPAGSKLRTARFLP